MLITYRITHRFIQCLQLFYDVCAILKLPDSEIGLYKIWDKN